MIHNTALARAAQSGTEALEFLLTDTIIALDELGYTTFEQAYKDGLITFSEKMNLEFDSNS